MSDELVSVAVWVCCGLLLGAVLEAERRGLIRGGQTWAKPVKAPLHTGGVIQRRPRAAVAILPCRLVPASSREIVAWHAPYVANCAPNDALVAETICALWRRDPPQDIYVEDD